MASIESDNQDIPNWFNCQEKPQILTNIVRSVSAKVREEVVVTSSNAAWLAIARWPWKLWNSSLSTNHQDSNFFRHRRKVRSCWNIFSVAFAALLLVFPVVTSQDDSRCFLLQGGSVQNFFVKESLPVGSVIGTLDIRGDPSENGDIYLRLDNHKAPVQISPNSKDLVLTEKLDKENKNGLAHVALVVICQKRKTDVVDTRIPIVIRVTDANDNAPRFSGNPYAVNVSEATVVGTIIKGDIFATDEDQKGPFSTVQYSIAPGPFSKQFAFESPISGALELVAPLDYETNNFFNLTIVAEDQGSPPQRTVTFIEVRVIDSDDQNPAFTRQRYMAFLPEPTALQGSFLEVQPEPIRAEDQDRGIRAPITYSLGKDVDEASFFSIEPETGRIFLSKDIPNDGIQQPVALSIVATQVGNADRVASSILTLSRRGAASTQLQFLQRVYEASLLESVPKGTLVAKTFINKNPSQEPAITFELDSGGAMGVFEVNLDGTVILGHSLDFERQNSYEFNVSVSDGEYNDTAAVRVNVLNVNDWDPRFRYPMYEFFVSRTRIQPGDVIGNVTAADGDNDRISFSIRGPDASLFDINSDGEILVRRFLELNSTEANVVLVAKDTGVPPRQSSVPVTIHFPKGLVRTLSVGGSSNFLLMVVFGTLVAVFVLVIVCLVIYIHKNKKYRDDKNAALPTKMSQIMTNGAPGAKLDPLSMMNQQGRRREVTGVETTITDTESHLKRGLQNGNLRASTISVRSQNSTDGGAHPLGVGRRFVRNPLSHGGSLGVEGGLGIGHALADMDDSDSLNGSNATTTSTATVGSDSPPRQGSSRSSTPNAVRKFLSGRRTTTVAPAPPGGSLSSFSSGTFDGTARATGGMPHVRMAPLPPGTVRAAPIPPAPPVPPTTPKQGGPYNTLKSVGLGAYPDGPSTSFMGPPSSPHAGTSSDTSLPPSKGGHTLKRGENPHPGGKKIVWPAASIPKKVKKLSWEDELVNQTELNPEVSVTPMPPFSTSQDAPNLTVYF